MSRISDQEFKALPLRVRTGSSPTTKPVREDGRYNGEKLRALLRNAHR